MMDTTEYATRLGKILGLGTAMRWPKQQPDQLVLMGAVALALDPIQRYSEPQINQALADWSQKFAPAGGLDYVTLRRYLIDFRFLDRQSDGTTYWVNTGELRQEFEPPIFDLDTQAVIDQVKAERAAQRAKWKAKKLAST